MTEPREYDLQVVIASGPEALGRAVLGLAFAISAVASGVNVLVILTLNGITWLTTNEPSAEHKINGFDSVRSYLAILKEAGVAVRLCSACVAGHCAVPPAGHDALREKPYIGLAEAAIRAARDSVQTVVF
ncbi:MAG: DsrE family protein [Sedimentisphaerales bacterium]|nr:DsrE family protein [Sedimentisphaerales bacterium]